MFHRTSFLRDLEKLKIKQVNSTARSADMAERRAAKHCCLRWNLWIVSFNRKSFFNLATVGPILMISTPMKIQFRSNAEKIKARAHRWAPARKKRITRLANFGKFWTKMLVPVFYLCQANSWKLQELVSNTGGKFESKTPARSQM